jgi:YAP binding domain
MYSFTTLQKVRYQITLNNALCVYFFPEIGFLQSVDIRQIADKFPDKNGGLRELYEKGPQAAFFLVKFWVSSSFSGVTNSFVSSQCLRQVM